MRKLAIFGTIALIAGACHSPDSVAYFKSHLTELEQQIDRCALHQEDPDSERCRHAARAFYELHAGNKAAATNMKAAATNMANLRD